MLCGIVGVVAALFVLCIASALILPGAINLWRYYVTTYIWALHKASPDDWFWKILRHAW